MSEHDHRFVSHVILLDESTISYAWMANKKGAGGIIRGASVRDALLFERAGGTSKPGPPLAARNSTSVHGATPDGGSLLQSKLPHAGLQRTPELERRQQSCAAM